MQRLQQAAAQAKEQNESESTGVAGEEDVEEMMHDAYVKNFILNLLFMMFLF